MWVTLLSLLVDDFDGVGDGGGDEGNDFNHDEKSNADDHDDDDDDDDDYDGGYYGNDDDNHVATPRDEEEGDKDKMGQPTGTGLNSPPFPCLHPGALIDHIQALDTLAALIDSPHGGSVMGAARLALVLLQVIG